MQNIGTESSEKVPYSSSPSKGTGELLHPLSMTSLHRTFYEYPSKAFSDWLECADAQVNQNLRWRYTTWCITHFAAQLIMKTCLYNFDPLKPHFYIVKLGFTWVYIIFLISVQNIDCGYSLEPPRRGGSNEYQQSMFWAEIWKILEIFYLKSLGFWW